MAKVVAKHENSFVNAVVNRAGKTAEQNLIEKAEDFVENAKVQTSILTSQAESDVLKAKGVVKQAEREVVRRQAAVEEAKTTLFDSFEEWVENYNNSKKSLFLAEQSLEAANSNLFLAEKAVTAWQEVSTFFN